ncbi:MULTISPECIES: GyrI-like domain-containing protein [Niastella]|uniref:GyrI-like domain-containing protein n=1 Tax=Niastella soli TaxID=2821487 RepID=A0ABS3YWY6_9BACT|nr:GyrI-like domain-containing protein [Niastella soli]MBO9202446.1 GyrI-like domain-containing protein [Niastella soli]
MEKLDLTKKYKGYYAAKATPEITEVGPAQFLAITGMGDPSDKPFANNIEALYSTAYAIKFAFKAKEMDFVVSKLEGLWWYDEIKYPGKTIETAVDIPRSEWQYKLLIRLPDFVSENECTKAKETVVTKKNIQLAKEVEYFEMTEGKCVQMLHVGPFSTEPQTLLKIGAFITANNFLKNGLHHEIYLSDFRKTEPAKLKTILREPVRSTR